MAKVTLGQMGDVNFPMDDQGRTFHVMAKRGEVANRIVTVGSHERGEELASMLTNVHSVHSKRMFVVHTGLYNQVPVSVVVSNMGGANMDFMIREIRAVVTGDLVIFRLGSCGALKAELGVGSIAFSREVAYIDSNFDAFHQSEEECKSTAEFYRISRPVQADQELTNHMIETFRKSSKLDSLRLFEGLSFSCDSYYSSQGRQDPVFEDHNENLFSILSDRYPSGMFFEMENFHLFHLAKISKSRIRTGAAAVPLANRESEEFIDMKEAARLTHVYCKIVLDGISSFVISEDGLMQSRVWKD